jgi:two-component system, OmpR family, sensor histidine kinase KdpD
MARPGQLRIYLGAAPGVGKTYAMLAEGHRRRERGGDVVVGLVEDHGRVHTAAQALGLEHVPRRDFQRGGATVADLDLDAVLARSPTTVLIDELAHENPPGARHAHRWQDVEELLAAGVEVISTLNVQQLESLSDAVTAITGVRPTETVPDEFARRADQIELVDMSPEALRRRLAHGNVYGPDQVDAALANYFRVGNLTALRELALVWLADRVDEGLSRYRSEHGIDSTWAARERIVVAVTADLDCEPLIRRGARIAGRASAGDLLAVYVAQAPSDPAAQPAGLERLDSARALVESLGGSFHTVVGDDVAEALLGFARGINATQLVLGASRAPRRRARFHPDLVAEVVRGSGDIDVLLVTTGTAVRGRGGWLRADNSGRAARAGRAGRAGRSGRAGRQLAPRRRAMGGLLAVLGPFALVGVLTLVGSRLSLPSQLLLMLALTVGVALVGGLWPALVSAVLGSVLINYFFTPPVHTFTIDEPENALALLIFVGVAVAVASVVDLAARHSAQARHSQAEAATLSALAGSALRGGDGVDDLLERLRTTFAMSSAALVERSDDRSPWRVLTASPASPASTASPASPASTASTASTASPASRSPDGPAADFDGADVAALVSPTLSVLLCGHPLPADDQRVVQAYAAHIGVVLQRERLTARALEAQRLEEGSAIRTALLAAVSHDLRTPLAGIKAAVSSLRQQDVEWSEADEAALLATIEESADRLDALVANLLDMSRLQTGSVRPQIRAVALDEVLPPAVLGVDPRAELVVHVPDSLPLVFGDAGLLERVVANLVENAVRHGGVLTPVLLTGSVLAGRVELRVVDRGPGVPDSAKATMFAPFQRLGDAPAGAGVGLGLAVAQGFTEATGGRLWAEDTPGGGLTMVLSLPVCGGEPAAQGVA